MYGFMQRSCVAYMALVVHSGAFWFKLIELLRTVRCYRADRIVSNDSSSVSWNNAERGTETSRRSPAEVLLILILMIGTEDSGRPEVRETRASWLFS